MSKTTKKTKTIKKYVTNEKHDDKRISMARKMTKPEHHKFDEKRAEINQNLVHHKGVKNPRKIEGPENRSKLFTEWRGQKGKPENGG